MDTIRWKWFRYNEIFDIKKGKRLTKENMVEGDIRYIGAIDSNNGLSSLIGNDTQLHKGNTISVSYNGSIGYAFYQDKEFWATDDVNVLYPKFTLNAYLALYLCTLIEKEQYRFCYGRKWDLEMMNKSLIKLPVTAEGTPDWQYMETFVKDKIIPQLPKKAQKVWLQKYDTKPQQEMNLKLNTDEWKWFFVEDLLKLESTKGTTTDELTEGTEIPYIAAKNDNNGCEMMCSKEDNAHFISKGNCIVFICLGAGSAGYALYQGGDFIGMSGKTMCGYNPNLNQYNGLFLASILSKERPKYSFGRSWTGERLKRTKIKLPVTPSGEPDWQFMEDYIKSLPYSKNLEPSKPDEVVDELVEMKKEMIKMRRAMEAQHTGELKIIGGNVTFNDYSTNYNVKK